MTTTTLRVTVIVGLVIVLLAGLWLRGTGIPLAATAAVDAGLLPADGVRGQVVALVVVLAAIPGVLVAAAVLDHARQPGLGRALIVAASLIVASIAQCTAPALGRIGTGSSTISLQAILALSGVERGWTEALSAALIAGNLISVAIAVAAGVRWYLVSRKRADTLKP